MNLSIKTIEALISLRGHKDFVTFLNALEEDALHDLNRLVDLEGITAARVAGGVRKLREWQKHFHDAPQVIEKLKLSKQR